jgi:ABC-type spermidine/putrescine transport system permease subunit I
MSRSGPRMQAAIALLVLLPFWTSLLVRNYALIYILQRTGVVNRLLMDMGLIDAPLALMFNEFGVIVGMTNALLPFMVFPIYVSLQAQDKALVPAAFSLGSPPAVTFFTVTLPLSIPGIAAGAAVTFATALGFYVTPALLGGGKIQLSATYIAKEINEFLDWPVAAAASMVLLAVVVALLALQRWAASLRGARTRS